MTPAQHAAARAYYSLCFLLGLVVLLASAMGLSSATFGWLFDRKPSGLIDFLWGTMGFFLAVRSVSPLVRLGTPTTRRPRGPTFADFDQSSLPRRVFFLLLAVAEVDGHAGPAEKDLVRRFLLSRFVDPITVQDLQQWEAQALPRANVAVLAGRLAAALGPGERDTIFYWSCLVAFADGGFANQEHLALQAVARGLGIPPQHARGIFHQARAQHLNGGGPSQRPDGDFGQGWRNRTTTAPRGERSMACAVLGLDPSATQEQIKKRHRELVKLHHPDAQPNLGPVAQAEATARFRQIQRAYEILTA